MRYKKIVDRYDTHILTYGIVWLLGFQIAANCLYYVSESAYVRIYDYIVVLAGFNLWAGLFFVSYARKFKFCRASIWCAYAQIVFAVVWLVIKNDNDYNKCIQIAVGLAAEIAWLFLIIKNVKKKRNGR